MCKHCFDNEFPSFPSEDDWLKFDLELTKKLGSDKMKQIEFRPDGIRDKDDGEYIYQCNFCHEKWKLKDPDYSFRGYFMKTK
ncbi:hypothetical protein [Mangrovibacterium diazotrophicum]|uniref:Uncharacterized protein n=1 Tax=Mangrovibacterium diazotrophicum TaxID=1261403 RepID=A0A419VU39_9BACT|nr:hypothetical protein [Mangrovibacterium diazotrophicum]RKD85040.1 hypothetical protein BC643_4559 [Mangrovibacterium diazotrophicum]